MQDIQHNHKHKSRYHNKVIAIIITIATTIVSGLFYVYSTSALSYQNNTNIQFTFSPTISVSISGNLTIDDLSPGTAKDSNIVDVAVATNNVSGYSLSATVGTNTGNTDLTNTANSTYKFTNLSSNVSTLTSFNDNTWGYSYSTDNGANWVSGSVGSTLAGYNGLPLDTNVDTNERGKGGITLVDTYNAADSQTIKFKIGAMSSSTQASGTYTNTINFYAITKVPPISISDSFAAAGKTQLNGYYKMQDMSPTICNMTQTIDEDSQTELIDIRDNKIYWIAKLQDGHCWMTQNLDLDLTSGVALTSETTDLTTYGTAPYIEGYTSNNGVIYWAPQDWTSTESTGSVRVSATTRTPNGSGRFDNWINGTSAEGADQYKDGYIHPLSADPGNYYQTGVYFGSNSCNYISSSCPNTFSTSPYPSNGAHGHVGNYYNWNVSIASNNTGDILHDGDSPHNSVCPKSWGLPITGDYMELNDLYNESHTGGSASHGYDAGLFNAPLYLVRGGDITGGSLSNPGVFGDYWLGVSYNSVYAYHTYFDSKNVVLDTHTIQQSRFYGFSIRCLAK